MTPDPDQPYVGRNAFAHKAGMHAAGVEADARTFEHLDPAAVGNEREILASELSGKATIRSPGRAGRARARRRGRRAGGRAAEGARAPRLPLRGGAGLLRAAAAPRGRQLRAALQARELPRDRPRSAPTARSRPRRRSRSRSTASATSGSAEGNGPVNALDRALRGGDRRPPPAPRRHRADQLQGADPRRDATAPARSPGSCSTPPTASASGARSASRRTSSRPPGRRWSTRSSTPSSRSG